VTAFADEMEREKARQRTYDAMLRKAKAGHVAGGRVFGYDNHEVFAAPGERSRVERRINEAEADVVRAMFAVCEGCRVPLDCQGIERSPPAVAAPATGTPEGLVPFLNSQGPVQRPLSRRHRLESDQEARCMGREASAVQV